MATDQRDGGEGGPDPVDSERIAVGEYTWIDFMREHGYDDEVDTIVPTNGDTAVSADDGDATGGTSGKGGPETDGQVAPDFEAVSFAPEEYLGFGADETADHVGGGRRHGKEVWKTFLGYIEDTPVVKDEYLWEHFKWEYYYERDGSLPVDGEGAVIPFERGDHLGFEPDRIGERLSQGGTVAEELADLVDRRTVDVAPELDEDAFFSDRDGNTTLVNRYDLEKAVSMEKKRYFREMERYWVNKPYAFVILFFSERENEQKYYVVEPYRTSIESDLQSFLSGKLRAAIKYASDDVVVEGGEKDRRDVIDRETRKLLNRYELHEGPTGTSIIGGLLPSFGGETPRDGASEDGFVDGVKGIFDRGGDPASDDEPETTSEQPEAALTERLRPIFESEESDETLGRRLRAALETEDSLGERLRAAIERGSPRQSGGETTRVDRERADLGGELSARQGSDGALTGRLTAAFEGEEALAEQFRGAFDSGESDEAVTAKLRAVLEGDDSGEESGDAGTSLTERLTAVFGNEESDDDGGKLDGIEVRPEPVLIEEDADTLSEYQVEKLLYYLERDFIGYERIDAVKHDINVEDISCDGYNTPVFVYHTDYEQIISNVQHGEESLDNFVVKLAQRSGKGISKRQPQVDATLPDGSRAQLTLGEEVSDHGTNYTIRQFKDVPFTPVDQINWRTFSLDQMAFLWLAIENDKSLMVAGGTASGKTTALNALSLFIPANTKIVSIEDTREVELPQRNWIASVTRPSFSDDEQGDINEFDLLEAALRQRPDYIVMGEVRGEEGRTLFQIMSTGHTTYTTFHADSVSEVLKRFTTDPINVSKTLFTALDLVAIQRQTRLNGQKVRKNAALTEINHYDAENDEINVQDIYQWIPDGDEFQKQPGANTLQEIAFDRGWSQAELDEALFKRQVVLAYLIDRELNQYAQVAATTQAFIQDADTILTLIANDRLEESLEYLREMESVFIDVDPEKEELVPRPEPGERTLDVVESILDRAEEELFPEYRGEDAADIAQALSAEEGEDIVVDSPLGEGIEGPVEEPEPTEEVGAATVEGGTPDAETAGQSADDPVAGANGGSVDETEDLSELTGTAPDPTGGDGETGEEGASDTGTTAPGADSLRGDRTDEDDAEEGE